MQETQIGVFPDIYSSFMFAGQAPFSNREGNLKWELRSLTDELKKGWYRFRTTKYAFIYYENNLLYVDFKYSRFVVVCPMFDLDDKETLANNIEKRLTKWHHNEGLKHLICSEPYEPHQQQFVKAMNEFYARITNGKSLSYILENRSYLLKSDQCSLRTAVGKLYVIRETRLSPHNECAYYSFDISNHDNLCVAEDEGGRTEQETAITVPLHGDYRVSLSLQVKRTDGEPYSHVDLYNDPKFKTLIDSNFAPKEVLEVQRVDREPGRTVIKVKINEGDTPEQVQECLQTLVEMTRSRLFTQEGVCPSVLKKPTVVNLADWLVRGGFEFTRKEDGSIHLELMKVAT